MKLKKFKMTACRHAKVLFSLALFVLAMPSYGVSMEASTEPRVVIPMVEIPASAMLDGQEGAWKQATVLENFSVLNSSDQPKEQSQIRLSYSRTHLYLFGRMTSFALDPVSNMVDSFKAEASQRDDAVLSDDSISIRITTPDSKKFQIAVNARGTIFDMSNEGDWEKSWNGDILVVANRGDGFWQFKMAIPFTALDLEKAPDGESLAVSVLRFDSLAKEHSVLVPRDQTMDLVLGGMTPFLKLPRFDLPVSSRQVIVADVGGANGQTIVWESELLRGSEVMAKKSGLHRAAMDDTQIEILLPLEKVASASALRFSVFADGHPIYRSPVIPYLDERREFQVSANAEVPFTLYLNGDIISDGKSVVGNLSASLHPGASVLAIGIPAGKLVNATITGPNGFTITTDSSWKVVRSIDQITLGMTGVTELVLVEEGDGISSEAISGKGDGDVFLYKTIGYRATSLAPKFPNEISLLSKGNAQFFHWDGSGLEAWQINTALNTMQIMVDVPEGIEFLGASGYRNPNTAAVEAGLAKPMPLPNYQVKSLGSVTYKDLNYERYQISRDLPVTLTNITETWLERMARRKEGMIFAIRPSPDTPVGAVPPMYYWMEANQGNLVEVPNRLLLDVQPALEGQAPKEIIFSLYSHRGLIDDEDLLEAYFDSIQAAGINEVIKETVSNYPREIGLRQSSFFNFGTSSRIGFGMAHVMTDEILRDYPESQAIAFSGKKMTTPCLSWLARHDESWSVIDDQLGSIARRNPSMTHLFWDYEFPPFPGGLHAYPMFSTFGIETFKQEYKIDDALTSSIIREKYHDEWVEFTCGEVAQVVKRLQAAAAQHGLEIMMYSGYQIPYTNRRYNVNWEMVGPYLDTASSGYTTNRELINHTAEAIGDTPLVGALLYQGESIAVYFAATIVRKVVDHRGGILFWYESAGFDDRTLAPISTATRFASTYEEFILSGERLAGLPGMEAIERAGVVLLRLKNEVLLVFLNEKSSPEEFELKLPENIEVISPEAFVVESKGWLKSKVAAGGIEVFLLKINDQ